MRIVHVVPFYTPVIGGVEEVARKIAEYTASRGYETHVVTYNRLRNGGIGSLPREEEINGVHVIRLKPDLTWSNGTYSSELPQVIRRLKPDIVHVHVWRHPHVFQVARLRRELGFRAILHGHAPFHRLSQLGLITWLYHKIVDNIGRKILDYYDYYVSETPYERDLILQRFHIFKEKITIIPIGIEKPVLKDMQKYRSNYEILYLGRISREKNVDFLIRSIKYVINNVKDIKLLLIGPDEGLMKWIYNYAKANNFSHLIKYLGPVYGDKKYSFYISATIHALPSLYEAFGKALLEASIVGTPSVITGYGGQLYAAPPNIASLWARPNPRDYAEAISTILTDKVLWRKLSQGAREWAELHTWDKILLKYDKLYNELTK